MTPGRMLWAWILVSTALRLIWAGAIGPGNDEAYHYLYAVHPAWSYFDHPPMMAVVAWLGMHLCGGSSSILPCGSALSCCSRARPYSWLA